MGKIDLDQQNESGDNIAEKKKKVNSSKGRAPRRSTKKREKLEDYNRDSSDRDHVCLVQVSSDDDDMELTVEDLMAIAEQVTLFF
jgi:hypothetical protein